MAAFQASGITRRSLFGVAAAAALAVAGLFFLFYDNHTARAKGAEIRPGNAVTVGLSPSSPTATRSA